MAIQPAKISIKEIVSILDSKGFKEFHQEVKKALDIEDINALICIQDWDASDGGYITDVTNASLSFPKDNYDKLNGIKIYTAAIKQFIEARFQYMFDEKLLIRITELCVKYTLVHELAHIQQYKNGKITNESIVEEFKISYAYRPLENEADSIAMQLISSLGEFEAEIIPFIILRNNKQFNLDISQDFIQRYAKLE